MSKTKLELTWIGKNERKKLEPHILLEDSSKSYHSQKVTENDIFDNKLIFGDNLLALKALEQEYAGKVKCVYYAKDRTQKPLNKIYIPKGYDTGYNKYLLNPDDHYKNWTWCSIADAFAKANGYKDAKEAKKKLPDTFDDELAQFAIDNAERVFQSVAIGGGAKIKRKETIEKSKKDRDKVYVHPNEDVEGFYIANGRQMVFYSNRLLEIDGEMQPAELITDVWTDISWNGIANEGGVSFKNGKKPEALLKRIFEMCTREGDLVLDSFGGSGTTAAVAHKMKRRWISIELGDHCHTHIIPRLEKVIDGEDQGGISKSVSWQGGGGFRYYKLTPALVAKDKSDQ